jgi:WS/DGAT/MGAT family acyltransferase
LRLHHVVADGAAALELFSSLFDPAPGADGDDPVPAGGAGRDAWTVRFKVGAAAGLMLARQGWAMARLGRAPALSWNRPVGRRRVHLLVRGDLAGARGAAHRHGATINDVLLAAVAGGAHRLLESRGQLVPGLDLHVSVPASIRRPGESGGNRVGIRVVAVPVSTPDPAGRLTTIASRTAAWRELTPLRPNGRLMQRWAVRVMARQRLINMVVSNMPGPPLPLTFDGAPVREVFQLSLLQGNCAIGVGALSYAGQLNVDVVADPDLVPDARAFAEGIAEALALLGAAPASAEFVR